MSEKIDEIPEKFVDMYVIMGGNPNYGDTAKLTFNRRTGMLEEGIKSCQHCLAIIPVNADICTQCNQVTL